MTLATFEEFLVQLDCQKGTKNRNHAFIDQCAAHPRDTTAVQDINPLKPELNPFCYLLALLAHHFSTLTG